MKEGRYLSETKYKCIFDLYLQLCLITLPHNLFQPQYSFAKIFHVFEFHPGLPDLALSCNFAFPTSCLNCHTQHLTVFTSTYLFPCTACMWWWMSLGGIFSAISNSVMACYLNHTSSQPFVSTGIKLELRIAVSSRLPMVEGRYVTSWNQFCPVFFTLIKNMTEEAKLFCPLSYVKVLGFQCCYQLDSEPVCICMY